MKEDKLLPIGSVVLLKEATHRLMIIGFSPVANLEPPQVYDYWGCFYPEGQVNPDQFLAFNHEDIVKVYGTGYSDDSEKQFRSKVTELMKKVKDENGKLTITKEEIANYMMNGGKK